VAPAGSYGGTGIDPARHSSGVACDQRFAVTYGRTEPGSRLAIAAGTKRSKSESIDARVRAVTRTSFVRGTSWTVPVSCGVAIPPCSFGTTR